jgi:prephenate dehydrogenase
MQMQATVVGLGLMGGSIARDIRRTGWADRLVGVESNPAHAAEALARRLTDVVAPLEEAVRKADIVILATPVDAIVRLLPQVLDLMPADAVATDIGSTKLPAVAAVRDHRRRGRYVAFHPMAGTENAGPAAAADRLFEGKVAILCDTEASDADALERLRSLTAALGMRTVQMDAASHDRHAARLSHMPHVVAFALALTALQEDGGALPDLAGGGFASMVRTARSGPAMWLPILLQNRRHVSEALARFTARLHEFADAIGKGDGDRLRELIAAANAIREALPATGRPPDLAPEQ